MLSDDIRTENGDWEEAVSMLPPDVAQQREFRIQRAMQMGYLRQTLPKDQWTKFDDVSDATGNIRT